MRRLSLLPSVLIFALSLVLGAPAMAQPQPGISKADLEAAIAAPWDNAVFEAFLAKLPQVTFPEQGNAIYYVLEGDLLLNREQVRATLMGHALGEPPAREGELRVMAVNGIPQIWPRSMRNLTYAVARNSFATPAQYQEVVANMRAAAQAWSFCAECGVSITHQVDFDANPQPGQTTFIVRYAPGETRFIAAAFFPNYPPSMRQIIIAPSYFTTSFDHTGVLRHELGHVLGYRHEHIIGVPGCYMEDNNWVALTKYDPSSVMHYPCGGGGTLNMELRDSDRAGHRAIYMR